MIRRQGSTLWQAWKAEKQKQQWAKVEFIEAKCCGFKSLRRRVFQVACLWGRGLIYVAGQVFTKEFGQRLGKSQEGAQSCAKGKGETGPASSNGEEELLGLGDEELDDEWRC